jgi:FMN phosphatase YigB (HAD superfamily)
VVSLTPRAPGRPPAAVLFDLYDTLVHASPRRSFYQAVPAALAVSQQRCLARKSGHESRTAI